VWTPPISEQLQAALARPGASWVNPPRPVTLDSGEPGRRPTGWLYRRTRLDDGSWLGLAAVFRGRFFEGAELGWQRAEQLHTLS
jgi:hypothetical protein